MEGFSIVDESMACRRGSVKREPWAYGVVSLYPICLMHQDRAVDRSGGEAQCQLGEARGQFQLARLSVALRAPRSLYLAVEARAEEAQPRRR